MNQDQWDAVDSYLEEMIIAGDPVLEEVLAASAQAGLPAINVSPSLGKFLHLMARIQGARSILEIGTLAGYSTIWLARALPPGGRLITLEADERHVEIARANIARAGLEDVVQVRPGLALNTLSQMQEEGQAPFDMIFIDADKRSNPDYLGWALKLARTGTLIVVDNVVRGGAVIEAETRDPHVQGVRRFFEMLAAEPRLSAAALQTVGSKGYDGLAVAVVTG